MNTCRTCKWWVRENTIFPRRLPHGDCRNYSVSIRTTHYGGYQRVRADFGCIFYQSRQPKEQEKT